LLAERHNLWIKASAKPGIFVTAFEKALRAGNIEQMAAVGKRYPRWALLAVVAGALIGDEDSAAQVKKLLSVEAPSMVPAIEVVRNAVGPLVAGTNDSNEIVTCLAKYRSRLFPVLYDASEATVSEFSLVA
jgi:hypothetical protein